MMRGWAKSPSQTLLIPTATFQKEKGKVCPVLKRRGYLPSGGYLGCVSFTQVKVPPLCPEALNQSPTPASDRVLLPRSWQLCAAGSGSCSEAPRTLHETPREARQLFPGCGPWEMWELPR